MKDLKIKGSLGEKLKYLREERGFSLDVVSEKTNLKKIFILSLEEENFDKLPTIIHARGFLKTYVQFLGVSCEEFLEEFDVLLSEKKVKNHLPFSEKVEEDVNLSSHKESFFSLSKLWLTMKILTKKNLVFLTFFSFIVGVCFFLLALFHFGFKHRSVFFHLFKKTKHSAPVETQLESSTFQTTLKKEKLLPRNVSNVKKPFLIPRDELIVLRAVFLEKTWISIKGDGQILYEGFLTKGDCEFWKANQEISVQMSCSDNISFRLNGKVIEDIKKLKPRPTRMKVTHMAMEFE